jgi:hypothetical protein
MPRCFKFRLTGFGADDDGLADEDEENLIEVEDFDEMML